MDGYKFVAGAMRSLRKRPARLFIGRDDRHYQIIDFSQTSVAMTLCYILFKRHFLPRLSCGTYTNFRFALRSKLSAFYVAFLT